MAELMARFPSPEWFAEVQGASRRHGGHGGRTDTAGAVLEQVVEGTPDGDVTYLVEVTEGEARIRWPVTAASRPPDVRFRCDWSTAVAIARGELSTQRALMQGRLRVSGHPRRLADLASALAGLDPVPAAVREATTFADAGASPAG